MMRRQEFTDYIDHELIDIHDDGSDDLIDDDSALNSAEELASRVRRMVELRDERDQTKIAADNAKKEFESYQAATSSRSTRSLRSRARSR
jgi:RNase H-fold protein (predicted Holliday junction resolvase)